MIRRACEIEIASAKCGKTNGSSVTAKVASIAPSTNAAHSRRCAKTARGSSSSAATAIAPARPKSSGASR